jgi:hypothetical protein
MTNDPALTCTNEQRRQDVRAKPLYGLASLEVRDQRTLVVTFLGKAPHRQNGRRHHHGRGYDLGPENVRVCGGRRVRDIRVTGLRVVHTEPEEEDDWMEVTLDKGGDFSTYTLEVVKLDEHGRPSEAPPDHFDPRYARLPFSFKVDCPSDFDCAPTSACPPEVAPAPEINYLAKDYASFRQLILDRLALVMPGWTERHVPDLGIALVEILAYVGDYLSYYQDAVATEAYLRTARQRISVRRHVRLVDYRMHEGCNARAWVCVRTSADVTLNRADVHFITGYNAALPVPGKVLTRQALAGIPAGSYETFEPLSPSPEDVPGPFLPQDVLDWPQFLRDLKKPRDEVSIYLRAQFGHHTRELLEHYPAETAPSDALLQAVLAELNRVLGDDFLYDPDRFAGRLSNETRELAKQQPRGKDLLRFNRWLLEDAYRDPQGDSLAGARRIYLVNAHNQISFYTWGDTECCLPRGATSATLVDDWADGSAPPPAPHPQPQQQQQQPPQPPDRPRRLRLRVGDVLILGELKGPATGAEADADPTRRQAVRLTRVTPGVDPLYDKPVVEVEWDAADALAFPLCLSAVVPEAKVKGTPEKRPLITDVSVAWGNVVLADHGETVAPPEELPKVPPKPAHGECAGPGRPVEKEPEPDYFRPTLKQGPVTLRQPFGADVAKQPASALLAQDPRAALPQVRLAEGEDGPFWVPQLDLLSSGPGDRHFVAEIDNDGRAHLRFGDGELGHKLTPGTRFTAAYRVGNGTAGNVGAEAISHVVLADTFHTNAVLTPRNPLPATGGTDPEPVDEVRELAPHAFKQDLQRAVTADDYAAIARRHPRVERAAGTLRWTGSWYQVVVVIEPRGRVDADDPLLRDVALFLEPYRRIGHEVVTERVRSVPLDVTLTVCVLPHYLRGHVEAALADVFSNRTLPDGRRGFFHPDNWDLGENVYRSRLVAAAQAVEGVQTVTVTVKRHFVEAGQADPDDFLTIGPLEVARCDNDPNYPENGKLTLDMRGGR